MVLLHLSSVPDIPFHGFFRLCQGAGTSDKRWLQSRFSGFAEWSGQDRTTMISTKQTPTSLERMVGWMKKIQFRVIAGCMLTLMVPIQLFAQFNVQITVNSGSSTTTCTDPFSNPDPMWSVNIENQGWVTYPSNVLCYTDFPNVQYNQTFTCFEDIPPTLNVCFRAFENDATLFNPCNPVVTCQVELCVDVPIPPFGSSDFTIELPDGLASDGEVSLTIESSGIPGGFNDQICNALDLGILENGMTIGRADTSVFNNYCADNLNEPSPNQFGAYFKNQQGVWFQFTTGNNPGTHIRIETQSDPSNFGDPINLEVGVFSSISGTCAGPWQFYHEILDPGSWDETIYLRCPQPNSTYYILVDGSEAGPEEIEGLFGLSITEMEILPVGNLPCEANDLGLVPLGGSTGTPGPVSNGCADGIGDPPAQAFGVQAGVWFTFVPPPTGHVLIDAISDVLHDEIGLQLAVYSSSTNDCTGVLTEISSIHTAADLDESLELHCLDESKTYFLLVDGAIAELNQGIFTLTISDAGDETVTGQSNVTICYGETYTVGNSVYDQEGVYADTFQLASGCDSIEITTLTILEPISLNFEITQQGLNPGNTDGIAQVSPDGGDGNYFYSWSNGQNTATATGLTGGDNYCIQVTDQTGCQADTCFEMPYYVHFVPVVNGDTVDCYGDVDGRISFTASLGVPPYQYAWNNELNTITGSGLISADGQVVTLSDLPAGKYFIQLTDIYFDTTLTVEVSQPEELTVANETIQDVSCFQLCDGSISITVAGGTMPYQYLWSDGSSGNTLVNQCAGTISVTITDANNCSAGFQYQIQEPPAFLAQASEIQGVSCYEGNDGIATVTTNGLPATYLWSNGNEITQSISGLAGGAYTVTVTNTDGCTASSTVVITTPTAPVETEIEVTAPVICHGDENGVLRAVVSGPGSSFSYSWSSGSITETSGNLGAGQYSVVVTNDRGCTASASRSLEEPEAIQASWSTNNLTCLDPVNGGIVQVESVTGGLPPYSYSSDGFTFTASTLITGFSAGEQVFYIQDSGGCIVPFDAYVEGPTELWVDLGEDQVIELGETIRLEAQVNNPDVTFTWQPEMFLDCSPCEDAIVMAMPVNSTLFTVTVTDDFGCTAQSSVYIEVLRKRKVYVPNAFSPNGDGINDLFAPFTGNDVVQIKDFKVFDRQGNMVYSAGPFTPGDPVNAWDGSFRGKEMAPGVFVWFAEIEFLDQETEIFKGDVTLIR